MPKNLVRSHQEMGDNLIELEGKREELTRSHWWQMRCLHSLWRKEDPETQRKALVKKNGAYGMFVLGLGEHKRKFLADIYITLIDLSWKYLIVILFAIYLIIFFIFAVCWWFMAYNNGDIHNFNNTDHEFCLKGVKSFPDAVMFSMETQTTIGYGFAYPRSYCGATVPLMFLQVIMGLFLETVMLGSIFVKIAQPKHRTRTILFSKHAVISLENGKLVLQVRVGDLRRSHLVDASISGMVVRSRTTTEGAVYPLYQFNCEFTCDQMADRLFLLFPIIVKHVIDEKSPLYSIDPGNSITEKFEIILYLTGTVESTGEVCQARTSYLNNEILWGYRFARIEEFNTRYGQWRVNFKGFNNLVHCQNILHCAREFENQSAVKSDDENDVIEDYTARAVVQQNVSYWTPDVILETTDQSESLV